MSTPTTRTTRKKGRVTTTVRSVRAPKDILARAEKRAEEVDGTTLNRAIIELLEGYARGIYVLPQKRVVTERVYGEPSVGATVALP